MLSEHERIVKRFELPMAIEIDQCTRSTQLSANSSSYIGLLGYTGIAMEAPRRRCLSSTSAPTALMTFQDPTVFVGSSSRLLLLHEGVGRLSTDIPRLLQHAFLEGLVEP